MTDPVALQYCSFRNYFPPLCLCYIHDYFRAIFRSLLSGKLYFDRCNMEMICMQWGFLQLDTYIIVKWVMEFLNSEYKISWIKIMPYFCSLCQFMFTKKLSKSYTPRVKSSITYLTLTYIVRQWVQKIEFAQKSKLLRIMTIYRYTIL